MSTWVRGRHASVVGSDLTERRPVELAEFVQAQCVVHVTFGYAVGHE